MFSVVYDMRAPSGGRGVGETAALRQLWIVVCICGRSVFTRCVRAYGWSIADGWRACVSARVCQTKRYQYISAVPGRHTHTHTYTIVYVGSYESVRIYTQTDAHSSALPRHIQVSSGDIAL